jgi:hypothetical protein
MTFGARNSFFHTGSKVMDSFRIMFTIYLGIFLPVLRRCLLLGKDAGIARKILDLFKGDDGDFSWRIDFEYFHIITNGVTDSILEFQLFIIDKSNFDPILHRMLLSKNSQCQA